MSEFCDIYNLKNLIIAHTCYKIPLLNPSLIDLMLTNRSNFFQNNQVIETGLSNHHRMTITVLKTFFQNQSPICIKYRDSKKID